MKLLWVGDAGCPSGFARATHEVLKTVCQSYDVTVLGINYRGDPHPYPYPMYTAAPGGDAFGVGRLIWMCDYVRPDVIVVQNDGWNIPHYIQRLRRIAEYAKIPVIAAVAVDGKNFRGEWLDGVTHAIFWTEFAKTEARRGGYEGPATVIPLGIDLRTYRPMNTKMIRAKKFRGMSAAADVFLVGNVNRNQPRKRWDLTVRYFAKWVVRHSIDNAYLFLHTAPTGDIGFDIENLMSYYGVLDRLIMYQPSTWYGASEEEMAETYNCFDVGITTTQGEGWGLTTLEAMACGVPVIAPDWAALGEWARDGALLVPCTSTAVTHGFSAPSGVIGGVPDEEEFVKALEQIYRSKTIRDSWTQAALACAARPDFQWEAIGKRYVDVLTTVTQGEKWLSSVE